MKEDTQRFFQQCQLDKYFNLLHLQSEEILIQRSCAKSSHN